MTDTNDTTLKPMTDSDIEPASGGATLRPDSASRFDDAKQAIADNTAKVREQASDKALGFAEQGKTKATALLTQLSQLLSDAAGQVDDKLGAQYGQYARTAADQVSGFSSTIDAKSVDELFEDARTLVRKSPGVAIGAAAAIGFVVARLLSSGLDQRDQA